MHFTEADPEGFSVQQKIGGADGEACRGTGRDVGSRAGAGGVDRAWSRASPWVIVDESRHFGRRQEGAAPQSFSM
jgi:hypothetical protein